MIDPDEGPCGVEMTLLPYGVAILATDGKWYVKAAFHKKEYAAAYVMGMASAGVKAKIVWDDPEKDIRLFTTPDQKNPNPSNSRENT